MAKKARAAKPPEASPPSLTTDAELKKVTENQNVNEMARATGFTNTKDFADFMAVTQGMMAMDTTMRKMKDAFSNPAARMGAGTNSLLEGTEYPMTRRTRQYQLMLSLYRSSWLTRKIVDGKADDMVKNKWELVTEMTPEEIDRFEEAEEDTQTVAHIGDCIRWGRLFGGCLGVMMFDGQQDNLKDPFEVNDVELGSYRGILVLDRWSGASPGARIIQDICDPSFGLPAEYHCWLQEGTSFDVHHSRALRFTGPRLPLWERLAEMNWGISCYDDQTEILTRERGFVKFSDLLPSDFVATRSQKGTFEWQQPTRYIEKDHDGELYHFTSRSMDICVTGDHRMLLSKAVSGRGPAVERFLTAEEYADQANKNWKIPVTSAWEREYELGPQTFTKTNERGSNVTLSGDDYCALLGAYLAEGASRNTGGIEVAQQEDSKGYAEYKALFDRIDANTNYDGKRFVVWNKKLRDHFAVLGHAHEKYIPLEIRDLSSRQLEILLHFYLLGDGHFMKRNNGSGRGRKHEGSWNATTVSRTLADNLVEIAQKVGMSASISPKDNSRQTSPNGQTCDCRPAYIVHFRRSDYMSVKASKKPYTGKVYCVTVPSGVVYVSRNGKTAWCGNCMELVYDSLKQFDNTIWNIASLIFRANILGVTMEQGLAQTLTGSNAQAQQMLYRNLQALNDIMNNNGMMVLPKEGHMEQHSYAFGGLSDVAETLMLIICAASGYTMTKLFGRTQTGLGQGNEGDQQLYEDEIAQLQSSDLRPQLIRLLPAIAMSVWGKIPTDLRKFIFRPVRTMTNEERSKLANEDTTRVLQVWNAGLPVSEKTILRELKQNEKTTGAWSNITDSEIAAASETPHRNDEMGMGLMDFGGKSPKVGGPEGSEGNQGTGKTPQPALEDALKEAGLVSPLGNVKKAQATDSMAFLKSEAETIDAEPAPWIGFDLDGTLAEFDKWRGEKHIGDLVEGEVMDRLRLHLRAGDKVKIFTARADSPEAVDRIKAWLKDAGLPDLEVTNLKDHGMLKLYDDRAVRVERNTGKIVSAEDRRPSLLRRAWDWAKRT